MSGSAGSSGFGIDRDRVRRAGPVAAVTARTAAEVALRSVRRGISGNDQQDLHARAAERYAELFGRSKGLLMKVGQLVSFVSMAPFIPRDVLPIYRAALARLRDDAPPMAPELARDVLERELGVSTEEAFAEFEWKPLAAASIGQVHAARLHDGAAVAVKVQYPGVADAIHSDLENTELIATFLGLIRGLMPGRPRWDLRAYTQEIADRVLEELDYRREATNQRRFASIYDEHPFIHVPAVIDALSTERVLTQQLVHGYDWAQALRADRSLRDRWAEAIYRYSLGPLYRFGLFNADPHPGNYIFHDDGTISCLDFGCIKQLPREQVGMLRAIVLSALAHDPAASWRSNVEAGLIAATDPVDPDEIHHFWRSRLEYLRARQPYTITPAYAASYIERSYSPVGPCANVARHLNAPREYGMLTRTDVGLLSVLGELHATTNWRSIWHELTDNRPPATPMGKLEQNHFATRSPTPTPSTQIST